MTEMDNILLQEEVYWKQQARMLWLKDGERNTKFFHSWAKQRKRENRIHQLKLENGNWCMEEDKLREEAREFYVKIYTKDSSVTCNPSDWKFLALNQNTTLWLNREVTEYEIKLTTFNLGAHKAPGPDGIPAIFFQRFWSWVVAAFVLKVSQTGEVPAEMNESVICLLPKKQHPEDMSQFRPICLSMSSSKL